MSEDLSPFFSPRGTALIGASSNPRKLSHGILRNMIECGHQGTVHPVNPRYGELLGLTCYDDIANVPDPVDLAVIILPASMMVATLEACGKRGVKAVTIISGGFREVGAEGRALEDECVAIARRHGFRLLGPNCVGTIDLYTGLNTTFIKGVPERGHIAFLSQSGAVGGGVIDHVRGKGVGFSCFVSLGNEADVTETDMIEYLADDPNTRVITMYLEGITDGPRFIEVAQKVTREKPIVVLKTGRSDAGTRAVSSHTGALAGSYAAYQAAFQQSGVLAVDSVAELFDTAIALAYQPLPKGNRTVVLTNAGGPAAIASDSLAAHGLRLDDLSPETEASLREILVPDAQVGNPVDMLGGADTKEYRIVLEIVLADNKVDIALPILVPQALVDPVAIANTIGEVAASSNKPVLACFMGDVSVGEARLALHKHHVPMSVFPSDTGRTLGAMYSYSQWLDATLEPAPRLPDLDLESARKVLANASHEPHLGEAYTRPLLKAYGIPIIAGEMAHTSEEAVAIARDLGYPVALKIVSPNILHKSDVGGIKLDLSHDAAVEAAYRQVMENVAKAYPDEQPEGVMVEAMAPRGHEVIVGMQRDPQFGPLMMFGLGGIWVELMADVAFRVAPMSRRDALSMINQTKAGRLLAGLRGQEPADVEAVIDCILRLSQLALDFSEIEEIEINPLLVQARGQGAVALDARVVLRS
ncbi:MAG: acetate--CoA ligase family protein [Chloroflexi bacterium]|nr:acetate--CoA ligase family protein [Chloroflexota bacterium]